MSRPELFDDDHNLISRLEALEVPPFEMLTTLQQEALLQGPGWVEEPVANSLYEPTDPRQFVTDIMLPDEETFEQRRIEAGDNELIDVTNFASYFERPPEDSILAMRMNLPALHRLRIIFPEVVEALENRVAGHDRSTLPRTTLDALFHAHRLMRQLVDARDSHVMPQDTGEVDEYYLLR